MPDPEPLRARLRRIADFPQPGITFLDITPLLGDAAAFASAIDLMTDPWRDAGIQRVVGIEARGFILAAPIAYRLGAALVPVRKPGKLPWETVSQSYELEYGVDTLETHRDAVEPGESVLVVDDVLATGGTAAATCELIEGLGGRIAGVAVLLELGFLDGRARLGDRDVRALLVEG